MGAGWGDMCWAKSAHDASFDDLRSFHPQIFARPQEHESLSVLSNFVRVSAQLNMKIVSLSDYDAIVTAISGFFLLPKSALVYVGRSSRPLTLWWRYRSTCTGCKRLVHVTSDRVNVVDPRTQWSGRLV